MRLEYFLEFVCYKEHNFKNSWLECVNFSAGRTAVKYWITCSNTFRLRRGVYRFRARRFDFLQFLFSVSRCFQHLI